MAAEVRVPLAQLAGALGVSAGVLQSAPDAAALQDALLPMTRVVAVLDDARVVEGRAQWLRHPHPLLGGRAAFTAREASP